MLAGWSPLSKKDGSKLPRAMHRVELHAIGIGVALRDKGQTFLRPKLMCEGRQTAKQRGRSVCCYKGAR